MSGQVGFRAVWAQTFVAKGPAFPSLSGIKPILLQEGPMRLRIPNSPTSDYRFPVRLSPANSASTAPPVRSRSRCLSHQFVPSVLQPVRWAGVCLLFFFIWSAVSCGGGGGSQGGTPEPQNPVPTLSQLTPNSATAGSAALTLTVSGSGFISTSVLEWNGSGLATTYVSSTSLTALIPASALTSAGTANVTVQNPTPGGGTSGTLKFTISTPPNPVPTVTLLSPSSAQAGGPAFTLTVTGTQFISTSQVLWNSGPVTTTYVSSTSLTAQIPAQDLAMGSAGMANVTVQNPTPGGGTSSAITFTINAPPNPAPKVNSLSPSSSTMGGAAFTLTVTGTQFISTSLVLWNDIPMPSTYISSTSLTAQIPASDLIAAGSANVAVQNPPPGGGTSSNLTFSITSNTTPAAANLTVLNLEGTDLAWNPGQQKLYVAVPSASSVNPGTVTVVDPIAGSIVGAQQLSSAHQDSPSPMTASTSTL